MASLLITPFELLGSVAVGAVLGLAALKISLLISSDLPAGSTANSLSSTELAAEGWLTAILGPLIVAFSAPYVFSVIPGTDKFAIFGIVTALSINTSLLVMKLGMAITKYA